MATAGTFLTLSKYGIYYYQRWIPTTLQTSKRVLRVSLRTSDKRTAQMRSRILSVKFDELATDLFESPEDFSKAMEMLYKLAENPTKEGTPYFEYEDEAFLGAEDGTYNAFLLDKAQRFKWTIQSDFKKLQDELKTLKLIVEEGVGGKQAIEEIKEIINPTLSDEKNPLLANAFKKWRNESKTNPRQVKIFIRYAHNYGAKRLANLDTVVTNKFIEFYKSVPKGTVFDNFETMKEIIELPEGEKLSDSTLKKHFGEISLFLNDCNTWFPKAIDGDILIAIKGHKIKPSKKDKIQRPPYSDDELQEIFNPQVFGIKSYKHRTITSVSYWLPLLGLFSGAREGELVQLEKHNVYKDKDTGSWVMSIKYFDNESENDDKGSKEETSERVVPVHQQLIDLGFLDYVKRIDKGRLFEDEDGKGVKEQAKNYSKLFSRYVQSVGVLAKLNEQKSFHNFRHTVRTRLAELKFGNGKQYFDEWLIDDIVGHASAGRSIGKTTYTDTQLIEHKARALSRLQYDFIEFDKLIRWEKSEFWRKKFRG
jgi:integrase